MKYTLKELNFLVWCFYLQAKRQQRKLNFLITQTELYAHFIGNKLTGEADQADKILKKLDDKPLTREVRPGVTVNLEGAEEYDPEAAKAQALANVQSAIQKQQNKVSKWGRWSVLWILHSAVTREFGGNVYLLLF